MSSERVREIFLKNEFTLQLGHEEGVRVTLTDSIRDQGDIDELGITSRYIFCAICGEGEKAETFYGYTNNHEFLKTAIINETPYEEEDINCGQIGFQRKHSGGVFGSSIRLHKPLSSDETARMAELRSLIGGIQKNLWERDYVGIMDGIDQMVGAYYPAEDRIELKS